MRVELVQIWARKEGIRGYQRDKCSGKHGGSKQWGQSGEQGVGRPRGGRYERGAVSRQTRKQAGLAMGQH